MKKLMIAVAVVCAAVMAQAATANWKVSAANVYDGKGDSAAKYSGTAYFFNADATAQSALFALFAADTSLDLTAQTGYLSSGTVASGVINANTAANQFGAFEQGSGDHNFYFVLVAGDNMYLSATKQAAAGSTDSMVTVTFGSQAPTSGATSKSLPTDGFVAVGQWAAAPEPTSGLLMLLGMAGLALRRRRA